jgi:hypothetical protein
MLIVEFNTNSSVHNDKIIERLKVAFKKETPKIYTGEEVSIFKRIPVYDTEDIKENIRKRNQTNSGAELSEGHWQKRYRYANLWHFRCSVCEKTSPHSQRETPVYKFCPHCSSKMQIDIGDKENA